MSRTVLPYDQVPVSINRSRMSFAQTQNAHAELRGKVCSGVTVDLVDDKNGNRVPGVLAVIQSCSGNGEAHAEMTELWPVGDLMNAKYDNPASRQGFRTAAEIAEQSDRYYTNRISPASTIASARRAPPAAAAQASRMPRPVNAGMSLHQMLNC